MLFLMILFYYKNTIPDKYKKNIYYLLILVFVIITLFINEMYNCDFLLDKYPNIPFHALIEITGGILFFILCYIFNKL